MAQEKEQEQGLKLLGAWCSPFVYRVIWALKLKGIRYEYLEQDLMMKSPLLLECNPVHKTVPVLLHNGKPIAESLVILEYLDEIWKTNPILPEDSYQRAMARFWANFIEQKFTEVMRRVLLLDGEQQKRELKQAEDALAILEGELKGKKFLGGDSIGFLDIVLGWTPLWLGVIEEVAGVKVFDSLKYPSLHEWMERFQELPAIREGLPPKSNFITYFHKIREVGRALAARK